MKHFAGLVSYNSTGFLEKNRDTLYLDLIELLQSSTSSFLNKLYPPDMEVSQKSRKSSLSKQFQGQLKQLMRQLYKTQPHYIRCIKPNEHKTPLKFVAQNCYEQLTYSGVFEAVAIRKQGFPFRLTHSDFVKRYGKLCKSSGSGDAKKQCESVVNELKLSRDNVKIGKTRVSRSIWCQARG